MGLAIQIEDMAMEAENQGGTLMVSEKVKELEQENALLKEQINVLEGLYGSRAEFPKNCEYCQNFIQHYVKCGGQYIPTNDGHCAAGQRLKRRKAGENCKSFAQKQYGRNMI